MRSLCFVDQSLVVRLQPCFIQFLFFGTDFLFSQSGCRLDWLQWRTFRLLVDSCTNAVFNEFFLLQSLLLLLLDQLSHEFVSDNGKDHDQSEQLEVISLMFIVDNAETNSEYLSGGDHEGWEVLLELLDHPINKHLPHCAQHSHAHHMHHE
jgi:hypothetical protein